MYNKTVLIVTSLMLLLATRAVAAPDATRVVVSAVQEMAVGQPFAVTGIVQSRNDLLLSATVEGDLEWVAEQGEHIPAESVVAQVDNTALLLQKAELQLLATKAEIDLGYLEGEVKRLSALREKNMASETVVAEMTTRRDIARNELQIAKSRIAQVSEQISRAQVSSPVEGVIAQRFKQPGEFARRGEPLVRLVDTHALEVRIAVPLSYLNRVRPRSLLSVSVGPNKFEAPVRVIVPAGDEQSQTFQVLIDVPENMIGSVLDGQFAEVSVPVHQTDLSLVVPRDAVVLRSEGVFVFQIDELNVAKRIAVTLGEGQGGMVSINGAIKAGDRVVIRGVERLKDGQEVNPTS